MGVYPWSCEGVAYSSLSRMRRNLREGFLLWKRHYFKQKLTGQSVTHRHQGSAYPNSPEGENLSHHGSKLSDILKLQFVLSEPMCRTNEVINFSSS